MPPHPAPRLCAALIRWLRTVVMAPPPSGATPWVSPCLPCRHHRTPGSKQPPNATPGSTDMHRRLPHQHDHHRLGPCTASPTRRGGF
ncbi:hypothetical protein [Acidovorax sp. A1169]|uniref:hypothetical protein n=1 Tax=Acidovorax sp. A1169 TaxID=3059524 RepID=UPI002737828B|nr:hypothetical protein [Acidovorax sp. A1169]MDP4077261.1 hypothetical protein [Acidovorax sp. A1169]